ncbi:MAG: polyprenyl synthetase family protein [Actinobacteria bacterium]|nr:polyprenyl synthetase family protein [Actinomycetota bacterium]MBW3650470.1 polyprenyl synthetase family protein [Actinomycetota bacterium]
MDLTAPAGQPAKAGAPGSLVDIASRVEVRIDQLLAGEIERWKAVDPDLAEPLGSLRDLVMAGGKRLRPAFCHWAFVGAGGDPSEPSVIDAGGALELLHTFALIHDDVMDGSLTRRGLHAVHVDFQSRHAASAWLGEGRRFGEGVAILVGDLAFVYADLLLASAPRAALDVFTELRLEVNIGQYLDLIGTVRGGGTREAARRICVYKSGKYTVERPLHLGAALAGRLEEMAEPLSAYGLPLGEAFQLRDDLLGAFGDESLIGKPVGDDLREGKPTALVALARERARGEPARLLAERFGRPDLSDDEVRALLETLVETGALAQVEDQIDALVGESLRALEDAPVTEEAREHLVELAWFVAGRDH